MRLIFAVDYNDGRIRAKAGRPVPASISAHRLGVLKRAKVIVEPDPLDHDGDGKRGGSLRGRNSTASRGARKRSAAKQS